MKNCLDQERPALVAETNKCQKKQPPFYQCCCECLFHIRTFNPCTYENHQQNPRLCFKPNGWACFPMFDAKNHGLISNFPKHSVGCELHTDSKMIVAEIKLKTKKG